MTRLDKARKALKSACKRLEADQGRAARRNARVAVKAALKRVQAAVDAEYPTIRKAPKRTPRVGRKRPPGVSVGLASIGLLTVLKASGIRVVSAVKGRQSNVCVNRHVADLLKLADTWGVAQRHLAPIPWHGVTRSKSARALAAASILVIAAGMDREHMIAVAKRNPQIPPAIVAVGKASNDEDELKSGLALLGLS